MKLGNSQQLHRAQALSRPSAQRGSALITGLVFLVVLTLLGLSASSGSIQRELIARNIRDQNIAMQAAEAALQGAENWIRLNTTTSLVPLSVDPGGSAAILDDGACVSACEAGTASWWSTNGIVLGSGVNQTKYFPGVSAAPAYFIEYLVPPRSSLTFNSQQARPLYYRITARGTGLSTNTVRMVRSIYRR